MKLGLAADHGGYEMQQEILKLLGAEGHQIVDVGNKVYDREDDYPDFAIPLARAVATGVGPSLPTRSTACARQSVTMIFQLAREWRMTI